MGKIEQIGKSKSRPIIVFAKIFIMIKVLKDREHRNKNKIKQIKKNEVIEGKIYMKLKCN